MNKKSGLWLILLLVFCVGMVTAPPQVKALTGGQDYVFYVDCNTGHRMYRLHVPSGYQDGTAVPLVIDIHGYSSSAAGQRDASGMYELSDVEKFAVAYPEGLGAGTYSKGFNGSDVNPDGCCGEPADYDYDDVDFILTLKADVADKMSINKNYLTGISNGSYMCHRILCEAPEEFDAYAMTSAALSESWYNCNPAVKKPVLYMHGKYDFIQRIGGSTVENEQVYSVADSMAEYAARNGCSTSYATQYFWGGVHYTYQGCDPGLDVECIVLNCGHVTYNNSVGFDVAQAFWDFFDAH